MSNRLLFFTTPAAVILLIGSVGLAPAAAAPPQAAPPQAAPPQAAALSWSQLRGGITPIPTLTAPYHVATPTGHLPDPFWGPGGLWARPFTAPRTATGSRPTTVNLRRGPATWDPSSRNFFAMYAGLLVRIDRVHAPEKPTLEALITLFSGLQGHDIDVRTAAGVAVSREPNDTIVLHTFTLDTFAGGTVQRSVLLRGPGYFEPRFSPDGKQILLSQSNAKGGRMIIIDLHPAAGPPVARDIGQGYGASWHPAGDRVIFSVIAGRSQSVSTAELWMQHVDTGRRVALTATPTMAELEPAISPDGHFVAFTDGRTGQLYVAALPRSMVGGAR